MHARFWLAFLFWAGFAGAPFADAAERQGAFQPSAPALRIETGMHTAMINGIDVDAAERFLVTTSDDKTARVWDLKDGKPLQVLRPPQGAGNEGKLYAVAISPDGTTVAVAGWTGRDSGPFSVYLFDRASGTLIRSVSGLPQVVSHLSYSTDGRCCPSDSQAM